MKKIFITLTALTLASCAAGCTTQQSAAPVSKAQIDGIEVGVTAAVQLATRCLTLRIGPCGVVSSRAVIISDQHKAIDAFRRLRDASAAEQPAALAVATEALSQLSAALPAVPAK